MDRKKIKKLNNIAVDVRKDIVTISSSANIYHIASALSPVELLVALYFHVMHIDPNNPRWSGRDRCVLSKGHGGAALFSVLYRRGFFSRKKLETFCQNGSTLPTHPMMQSAPGVEATTGSLGHGLPIGLGMAMALRHEKRKNNVFVILSDGECDEGSVWESALYAGYHALDNLVVCIDYNKIQSFGRTAEVLDLEPLADKFRAFRWHVQEIDGHDISAITKAMEMAKKSKGNPHCIIAHTVKGRGISYMEDQLEWHYKSPQGKLLDQALRELGIQYER
ncbi:MAG: transketolase [Parcubacteria group bacterium Gr01-1014_29]|nr:MAG: transketolase [Parcubacteria group bacterium Gr01-1014_29]